VLVGCLCLFVSLNAWPVVTDAAPRKVTKELADQLFRSPATPQDAALAQSVKGRLQAMGAASATTATPGSVQAAPVKGAAKAYTSPDWWVNVAVDARSGHVRLSGKNLTPAQRAAAENVVRSTAGVESWDWGN
jgi:hypothetical protein